MAKLMALWLLVLSVATTALVTAQTSVPVGTECTQPRIRRPWDNFTPEEKTQYIEAVKLAMTRGFHQKFVELHIEWSSEKEAHQNCLFMYWHRMYLLGYENMLRSLKPEYQCITIPYWDHLSATARRASGTCNYMENCSPIYQDFGGSSSGLQKGIIVYNQTIPRATGAMCVSKAMLGSFCGNSSTCAGCVVRGKAYSAAYPSEAYFASVYQQVFTYNDWGSFALSIERGVHNTVHSALGGTMSYLQSPIDPIFYTHHAFIDALQTIYLKCQLNSDTDMLTTEQKGSDGRFWINCGRRTGGSFNNTAPITMMTRGFDGQWVHVRNNPNNMLYAFFKDLPPNFSDYVDAKDLGVYSYTYMFQGALTNMYTNCKDSNTITATTVSLLAETDHNHKHSTVLKPITKAPNKYDNKMRRWTIAMYEAAKLTGYTSEAACDQMEMIMCVHKRHCFGGVADYDPIFRANFKVTGHPRCYTIIKELESGDRIIGIPKWRKLTEEFFPCKKKKKSKKKAETPQVEAEAPQVEASALEL